MTLESWLEVLAWIEAAFVWAVIIGGIIYGARLAIREARRWARGEWD